MIHNIHGYELPSGLSVKTSYTFKFFKKIYKKKMEFEIRAVVHYFYLTGAHASYTAGKLRETYGDAAMSRTGVLYWYNEFKKGRDSIEPLHKPGRPLKNENTHAIQVLLDEFPFASARYIASQVDVSLNTVIRILKEELHLKKRFRRWVPKILNSDQKKKRKALALKMLRFLSNLKEDERYSVITCDESWFFLSYSYDAKWCREGEDPPISGKRMINDEKVMIFTAFSISGLVYLNALPTNSKFNSTYMCNHILPELTNKAKESVEKKTLHPLVLHFDNAKPHTAKCTIEKINELHWMKLDHPPYSPDISPNDFFLYGYVKSKLPGYDVGSPYDLVNAIKEICSKIEKSIWESVYASWLKRLKSVYESDGEYCFTY